MPDGPMPSMIDRLSFTLDITTSMPEKRSPASRCLNRFEHENGRDLPKIACSDAGESAPQKCRQSGSQNVSACPYSARASLRLLFVSKDLSLVKRYVQRQLGKVMAGRVPLRDFIFAKEVRMGRGVCRRAALLMP